MPKFELEISGEGIKEIRRYFNKDLGTAYIIKYCMDEGIKIHDVSVKEIKSFPNIS